VPVVAGEDDGALIVVERLGQRVDGVDVEMVARFVEHEHVVLAEQQSGEAQPGSLTTAEHGDRFLHVVAAE